MEHVTRLTRREWVGLMLLLVVMGSFLSYSAMYQAQKIGQFDTGGMAAMVVALPLVRYFISRLRPGRTIHLVNHLQTAVSAAGASVGMGSMLLAYEWVAGKPLTGWQVASIALPGSILGILVANLYAESWINKQKLTFPMGIAGASVLQGFGQGGKTLYLLGLGVIVSIPLVVWESPISAIALGTGWICGTEVMIWAMITALICNYVEPALKAANLVNQSYREVTIYFGAAAIIAAGLVDMAFIYFNKKDKGDNPEFSEREGFMPKRANLLWTLAIVASIVGVNQFVFDLPWYTTAGICGLLVGIIYIGGMCVGKTGVAPSSSLSGGIILFATMLGIPGAGALLFGALAGQAISNSMETGPDFRMGERVGSSLPLQRKFQLIGATLGGSIIVGAVYHFFMQAYGDQLTLEKVNMAEPVFNAGFALKYKAFLTLSDKLHGTVGLVCLFSLIGALILQTTRNILKIKGFGTAARFIPSPYACAIAFFIPFVTTKAEFYGSLLALAFLIALYIFGSNAVIKSEKDQKPQRVEKQLCGISLSTAVCFPSGFIVGESLLSFADALFTVYGHKGVLNGTIGHVTGTAFAIIMGIVAIKAFTSHKENKVLAG